MEGTSDGVGFGDSLVVGNRPGWGGNNSFSDGIAVAEEEIFGEEVSVAIDEASHVVSDSEHPTNYYWFIWYLQIIQINNAWERHTFNYNFEQSSRLIGQTFVGMVLLLQTTLGYVWETDYTSWRTVSSHCQRNCVDAEGFGLFVTHSWSVVCINITINKATAGTSHSIVS